MPTNDSDSYEYSYSDSDARSEADAVPASPARSDASYSSSDYGGSSYTDDTTNRSNLPYREEEPPQTQVQQQQQQPRESMLDWLRARAADAADGLRHLDIGPPVLYTPRDDDAPKPPPPRASRKGGIAAIPWRELVGLKEELLTHMEGAAVAEERLNEHASNGQTQAHAIRRRAAELDEGIQELEQVIQANDRETEAIASSLRRQIEQYKAELKAMGGEQAKLEKQAGERRRRELARGEQGLMGEVARKQEAKLEEARKLARDAKERAKVHAAVMEREVLEGEAAAKAPGVPEALRGLVSATPAMEAASAQL